MSNLSKTSEDLFPLINAGERTQHPDSTSQAETGEKGIVSSPSLPKQPAPVGFVYPTFQQLPDNPYATQEAYNPSYVNPTNNLPYQPDDIAQDKRNTVVVETDAENNTSEDDTMKEDVKWVTYCFIAIAICIVVLVLYFSIKHPKITKVALEVLNVAEKIENKHDPGISKAFNPSLINHLSKRD